MFIFFLKIFQIDPTSPDFEQQVQQNMKDRRPIVETDRLWGGCLVLDRVLKSQQDICIENSAGHNAKYVGVELVTTDQLKVCQESLSSHPLLEVRKGSSSRMYKFQLDELDCGRTGSRAAGN